MSYLENAEIVNTNSIQVKGKMLIWQNTRIQLTNVSYITITNLDSTKFPTWVIFVLLAGLLCFEINKVIAIILLVIGCYGAYIWFSANEMRKQTRNIVLMTNAGIPFCFPISNQTFRGEMLKVLEEVMIKGGVANDESLNININNCTFTGNAKLLNDLTVKK